MTSTPMQPSSSSTSTSSTSSSLSTHQRVTSGSFRINVTETRRDTSSSSPSSSSSPTATRSSPSMFLINNNNNKIKLRDVFDDNGGTTTNWSLLTRRTKKWSTWLIMVGVMIGLYTTTRQQRTKTTTNQPWWQSKTQSRIDSVVDQEGIPIVDRTTIDKLRLLELHFGADPDQSDENNAPVDGAGSLGSLGLIKTTNQNDNNDIDEPPIVVDVPAFVKPDPLAPPPPTRMPTEWVDRQFCPEKGGQPCSFVVAAWLGEQETKAQQHLHQLGLLALALNRTLVLPNVSKSRLGTCYSNSFDFYYSPNSLQRLGIPTITHEEFVDWTLKRSQAPTAQIVSMQSAKLNYPQGAIEIDSASDSTLVPNKPNRNLCLKQPKTRLQFQSFSPLIIFPPEGYHKNDNSRRNFGESVVNTLRSLEVCFKSSRSTVKQNQKLPNVLAFNYELRYPMMSSAVVNAFQAEHVVANVAAAAAAAAVKHDQNDDNVDRSIPDLNDDLDDDDDDGDDTDISLSSNTLTTLPPFQHFDYSNIWQDLSNVIVEQLSPFIAIHWRTETLISKNLLICSQRLIERLIQLKLEFPKIHYVYLATDYPIEELWNNNNDNKIETKSIPHSGTFSKVVTEEHHLAFKSFLKQFQSKLGKTMTLTTFSKQQNLIKQVPQSVKERSWPLMSLNDDEDEQDQEEEFQSPNSLNSRPLQLEKIDSGLFGILDKLIVSKSQIFLTGVPGKGSNTLNSCSKSSSFTNQLIDSRKELLKQQEQDDDVDDEQDENKSLWNVVTHWSIDGKIVDEE
ncbi:hypothetical protein OIO90_006057 [Microbotryomycetes sp. JL221]|nr:hypothetical protein OIO90_006057 [Microbotryomycetes sp. JL221]